MTSDYLQQPNLQHDSLSSVFVKNNRNLASRWTVPATARGSPTRGKPAREFTTRRRDPTYRPRLQRPVVDDTWLTFKLSIPAYKKLVESFQDDLNRTHWRWEYFVVEQEFIMGSESAIHDTATTMISSERWRQILALRNHQDPFINQFVKDLFACGGARIKFSKGRTEFKRNPDASCRHFLSPAPTIVVDTAYSQPKEHLATLARDYIFGSEGIIACVIGVKIAYPEGKEATVSVWEGTFTPLDNGNTKLSFKRTVDDQVFLTKDGMPNVNFPGLSLPLKYLASSEAIQEQIGSRPNDLTTLQITTTQLCKHVKDSMDLDDPTIERPKPKDLCGGRTVEIDYSEWLESFSEGDRAERFDGEDSDRVE